MVLRLSPAGHPEVLVVHRPGYDDWSFPKGKLDPGESELECALREVREETGMICLPARELTSAEYTDSYGRPKRVRYWTMWRQEGAFVPNDEVDEVRWLSPDRAVQLLSYPHDRLLLEELGEVLVILLIRHASAGKRAEWSGDDRKRPLDARGRKQADWLAGALGEFPITRILSSPYLRCVESVEPLAERLGLPVNQVADLEEGAAESRVRDLVLGIEGGPVALCTHGDVVGALAGPTTFNKKGSYRILVREAGKLLCLSYVPPNAMKKAAR